MIEGLFAAILIADGTRALTIAQDAGVTTETRVDIEGWDTICSRTNSDIACRAFRAVQGGLIILHYSAKNLKITVVADECSEPNAIEKTELTAPLAIALPWTINRYRGGCQLPALSSLPENTEQFESLMHLMVAN